MTNVSALVFDGTDDYAEAADHADFDIVGDLTVEAWIKNDKANWNHAIAMIVAKGAADIQFGWSLYVAFNSLVFNVRHNFTSYSLGATISGEAIDNYHHVAATWDAANRISRLYVNAALVATSSAFASGVTLTNTTFPVRLGTRSSTLTTQWWQGKIDEARIWNVRRSDTEIADYRDIQAAGTETGLVACWHLNENTGTTGADAAGTAQNLTITGATWTTAGIPTLTDAGGGDERTVAGDMPASSATLARTLGALRSVPGNQPASTGALARVYQAVRALTGDTPAPSGALAYLRGYLRALAGDMPAITGTLARAYQAVRSVAGSLPAQSGTLTRTAGAFARTLAGDLPAASGAVEYALGLITRSLEGTMPAATGAVSRTYQALRTLTGDLPAATGAVTRTAGAFVRSVVGDQPSASGALARTAGAFARALSGALGALSGAVSALGGLVTDTRASVTLAETRRHTVSLTVVERHTCTLSEEAAA